MYISKQEREAWNAATPEEREEFIRRCNQLVAIALPLGLGLLSILILTT